MNYLVQFVQSWKKSLELFVPNSFKLFVLVTIANILRTYKHIFTYFLPFFVIAIIGQKHFVLKFVFFLGFSSRITHPITFALVIAMLVPWLFASYLCSRPSVLKKNFFYFKHYIVHFCVFLAIELFVLFLLNHLLVALCFFYSRTSLFLLPVYAYLCISILLFPFFLLDAQASLINSFFSVIRSLLMGLYNFPALFIMFLTGVLIHKVITYIFLLYPFLLGLLTIMVEIFRTISKKNFLFTNKNDVKKRKI